MTVVSPKMFRDISVHESFFLTKPTTPMQKPRLSNVDQSSLSFLKEDVTECRCALAEGRERKWTVRAVPHEHRCHQPMTLAKLVEAGIWPPRGNCP